MTKQKLEEEVDVLTEENQRLRSLIASFVDVASAELDLNELDAEDDPDYQLKEAA